MAQQSIIQAPKGTARQVVPLTEVVIPDMWHLAMALQDDKNYRKEASEQVLECWHLCSDLLATLKGHPDYQLDEDS